MRSYNSLAHSSNKVYIHTKEQITICDPIRRNSVNNDHVPHDLTIGCNTRSSTILLILSRTLLEHLSYCDKTQLYYTSDMDSFIRGYEPGTLRLSNDTYVNFSFWGYDGKPFTTIRLPLPLENQTLMLLSGYNDAISV